MRFGRRGAAPEASYAAIVGDRWLWVALDRDDEVSLRGASPPAETDASQPGHHGTRLDLADLAPGRYPVLTSGRPLAGTPARPSGEGTAVALERDDGGHLHVLRRAPTAGARVLALRLRGERVEIDLDSGSELRVGGTSVPVSAGTAVLAPEHLLPARVGDLPVTVDGLAVRRRANTLTDPGAGALLPAVHPLGADDALARLRWAPDATLVLRVLRAQEGPA